MSNGIKTVLISELLKYFALELLKMPRIHECYANLYEFQTVFTRKGSTIRFVEIKLVIC